VFARNNRVNVPRSQEREGEREIILLCNPFVLGLDIGLYDWTSCLSPIFMIVCTLTLAYIRHYQ
jgi:cytochrome c biogenesis protein CcdA